MVLLNLASAYGAGKANGAARLDFFGLGGPCPADAVN